jgi:hypothetical protein
MGESGRLAMTVGDARKKVYKGNVGERKNEGVGRDKIWTL